MMRRGFLILIFCVFYCSVNSHAQGKPGFIEGVLADSVTRDPLVFSTVTVFNAADTALISYKLSDLKGRFKVTGLPLNQSMRVLVSFSGYKVLRKNFTLTDVAPSLSMDSIFLARDTSSLDEVIVYSERPPVLYRKDTIEFNASSFKYLPNALVEDLLKKFPGIEISKDGSILVNGQPVNKILVDGREFFGADIRIATRNLPANIIEKVQVFDDREQLLRGGAMSPEEAGKVINLKLKKYVKKGWFGKAYAGAGQHQRFENGAMLNLFRDTLQASLLYYGNNLSRPAFNSSDFMTIGGFARSFFHNLNVDAKGNVQNIDGISFGGASEGIESVLGAGVNISTELSNKTSLNFQYFYGKRKLDFQKVSLIDQFITDTVYHYDNEFTSLDKNYSHHFGGSLKSKTGRKSKIVFRPVLGISQLDQQTADSTNSGSNFKGFINRVHIRKKTKGNGIDYKQEIIYENELGERDNLSVVHNFRIYNNDVSLVNNSASIFNSDTGLVYTELDQVRSTAASGFGSSFSVNYQCALAKDWSFSISGLFDFTRSKQDIISYERNPVTGEYNIFNASFSDSLLQNRLRNNITVYFSRPLSKSVRISAGTNFQTLNLQSTSSSNSKISSDYYYIFPYLQFRVNRFVFLYTARMTEPSLIDLQSIADNTNTLIQRIGNPNLRPSILHSFSFGQSKVIPKKNFLFSFSADPFIIQDDIIYQNSLSAQAIQVIAPTNINGNKGVSLFVLLNKRYKFSNDRQLGLQFTNRYSIRRRSQFINGVNYKQDIQTLMPTFKVLWNSKDVFEFTQAVSYNWNQTEFLLPVQGFNFNSIILESDVSLRMPKHFVWEVNMRYQRFPGVNNSVNDNALLNASVSFSFLKNKNALLSARAFDLLKANNGLSQMISTNSIQQTKVNLIQQYYILSFVYNFRYFGSQKASRQSLLNLF